MEGGRSDPDTGGDSADVDVETGPRTESHGVRSDLFGDRGGAAPAGSLGGAVLAPGRGCRGAAAEAFPSFGAGWLLVREWLDRGVETERLGFCFDSDGNPRPGAHTPRHLRWRRAPTRRAVCLVVPAFPCRHA